MEITIHIPSIDNLAEAIRLLAKSKEPITVSAALPPKETLTPCAAPVAPVEAPTTVSTAPVAPVAPPVMPTAPVAPVAPIAAPVAAPVTPVPAQPVTYTRQQLAMAATSLVDANKDAGRTAIRNLLEQFGIKSLPALPEENFGAFATALRQLGAAI